jgi:hypothetical protein
MSAPRCLNLQQGTAPHGTRSIAHGRKGYQGRSPWLVGYGNYSTMVYGGAASSGRQSQRRSARIEAHAALILGPIEERPNIRGEPRNGRPLSMTMSSRLRLTRLSGSYDVRSPHGASVSYLRSLRATFSSLGVATRMPGRSPGEPMNSIPAASRTALTSRSVEERLGGTPSTLSKR